MKRLCLPLVTIALAACATTVKVEPVTVEPIHVKVDVTVKDDGKDNGDDSADSDAGPGATDKATDKATGATAQDRATPARPLPPPPPPPPQPARR
jgi:phage gp45-like